MITTIYDTALIFRREFEARSHILWAGLAVAAIALILPFLPSLSAWHNGDIRDLMAVALALGTGIVLSIGLGATLFGSDLSEERLGFFFERPVASAAIWLGRFLAVLLLVVLCEITILAPAGLSSYHGLSIVEYLFEGLSFNTVDWVLALLAGPAFLLLSSHCISVMIRARSAWLILDLVGFTLIGPAIWLTLNPLVSLRAETAALVVGTAIATSVFLALLAGTAASVSCGRTDLRRAHQYLSVTLWAALTITIGATAAYASWLVNIKPRDFDEYRVLTTSSNGKWIDLSGTAKGHLDIRRRYLFFTEGQRTVPLPGTNSWSSDTRVSSSGNRAIWRGKAGFRYPSFLWHVDLESAGAQPIETTVLVSSNGKFRLSPNGRRMAVVNNGLLSVYELEDERLIATARVPGARGYPVFRFSSPDNVRFLRAVSDGTPWPDTNWSVGVSELAIDARGKPTDHVLLPPSRKYRIEFDQNLRLCVTGLKPYGWRADADGADEHLPTKVFDAITGDYIKTVRGDWGDFLSGGGFWSTQQADSGEMWLFVEQLDGKAPIKHNLGLFDRKPHIFEIPDYGLVIASYLPSEGGQRYSSSYWGRVEILDIESGERHLIGKRLMRGHMGGRDTSVQVGRFGIRGYDTEPTLFQNEQGVLLGWDPEKGLLVPILGDHTQSDPLGGAR